MNPGIHSIAIIVSLIGLACAAVPTASASEQANRVEDSGAQQDFAGDLELLNRRLADQPGDETAHFKRAQILGWTGDYAMARKEFEYLLGENPDNVDYVLGYAQVLAWQGQDAIALRELAHARQLAPEYEAVWKLEQQLLLRQDDDAAGEALGIFRREAAQQFPQALWLAAPAIEIDSHWTVLVGLTIEDLSNDLPGWNQQFLEMISQRKNGARYFVRTTRDARFDTSDTGIGGGGDWQFADNWFAGTSIHFAPGAKFLPDYEFGAHAGRRFSGGWVVDTKYRRRNYATAIVDSYIVTTENYFGNFRAAYTLALSRLDNATNSVGHTFTLNWYRNERTSFGISINSGEEAEAIGAGQVLITNVRGINLTGRHALSARIGLDWWLGIHEQGDFYRRQYAGMAVSIGL